MTVENENGLHLSAPGAMRSPFAGNVREMVDLNHIFSVIARGKWIIAAAVIVCVLAAFQYLRTTAPIYTAYSQVILDTRQERVTNVEQVVSNLNVSNSVIAGEVVLIRGNLLIGKVVDRLNLVDHPAFDPRIPREPGLITKGTTTVRGLLSPILGSPSETPTPARTLTNEDMRGMVIRHVQWKLNVAQVGISYAIGISFEAEDPVLAARIANAVAEQYINDQVDAKRDATIRATVWLEDRIFELSTQVEEADASVVAFQAETMEEIGSGEQATNQLLAELNTKLVSTTAEKSDAVVRFALVQRLNDSGGLAAVGDVVTSPLLQTLEQQRTELAGRQAQRASTLGRRHPDMIRLSAQIADLNRSIELELKRQIENMRSEVDVASSREAALRAEIDEIEQRTIMLSEASVRLSQLERTASATRLVYENFLARYKEMSSQAEFQRSEARIISQAEVPQAPSAPRKSLLMALALVFGLSLGLAAVFLREALSKSVHSMNALRTLANRPVLAGLPYVTRWRGRRSWLHKELTNATTSEFMEGMRSLRAKLFDTRKLSRPKVLMVTSAMANEGKSSVSLALANVLDRVSVRAVVVDADLRRPTARNFLRLGHHDGCLTEYLAGRQELSGLVHSAPEMRLDVVAPLKGTNYAADLIASKRFGDLINRLSNEYDVVIIDAPPVLDISDAMVLSTHADATILAVRSNRTPENVVTSALVRLEEAGSAVVGTVMTQVRRKDGTDAERHLYAYN